MSAFIKVTMFNTNEPVVFPISRIVSITDMGDHRTILLDGTSEVLSFKTCTTLADISSQIGASHAR